MFIMARKTLILSTILLSKKDQKVVKSLCKLLSNKLRANWSVDAKAKEGDLIIFPEGYASVMAKRFHFQIYLNAEDDRNSLRYPFNSDEFVKKLNAISKRYKIAS